MKRGRILVVDDEANARTALVTLLSEDGYNVESAADGFKALPKLDELAPDVLLTDLKMPGMDGLALMAKARERDPEIAVVVMTAHGAIESAVAAMQQGATSYLAKPINLTELGLVIERAIERRRLRQETSELRGRLAERDRVGNMVGASAAIRQVFETIHQVAPARASVLITGESGTGKELVAAAIHQHSPRASGPFVRLNCSALAESVLESELFGHEKGAFTGAVARRDGRFQQAHGGTLFLDEIGEISPALQVKLLRFLQEYEFERVGGNQTVRVDVRVIAATNRDLMQRVRDGHFREDLYYRLNVIAIHVPPLREREGDAALLAMHFLQRAAADNGKAIEGLSDEALAALSRHAWPGNVRELENAVERAVVVARGKLIELKDLPPAISQLPPAASASPSGGGYDGPRIPGSTLHDLERYAILKTLEATGGSTSKAAEMLGISPRKIQYRLHDYGKADDGTNDR